MKLLDGAAGIMDQDVCGAVRVVVLRRIPDHYFREAARAGPRTHYLKPHRSRTKASTGCHLQCPRKPCRAADTQLVEARSADAAVNVGLKRSDIGLHIRFGNS